MTLQEIVYSNLNDAMENGYNISSWPADDIVADLLAFASDCEAKEASELKPCVIAWLENRKKQ